MALQPNCPAVQSPISPARSGCQRKKCRCICFTLAPRAFSAVVLRGQMQCVTHRENINNQYAHRPVADNSKSFKHRVAIFLFFKVCPYSNYTLVALKTNDHGFGNKQLETWYFGCFSLIVLQLLMLRAIKSAVYILYYYVCLPPTYQKANNIN